MVRHTAFALALLVLPGLAHADLSAALGAGVSAARFGSNDLWTEISLRTDHRRFAVQAYFGNSRHLDTVQLSSGVLRRTFNDQEVGVTIGPRGRFGRATAFAGIGIGAWHGSHTYPEAHWLVDIDLAVAPRVRVFGCVRGATVFDLDGNLRIRRYFGGVRLNLTGTGVR